MPSASRCRTAALAFLLLAGAAAAQPAPTVDPHERCRSLCAQFYGGDAEKRTLCESGCGEARACSEGCAERHPDDAEKRSRCTSRCARSR